MTKREAFGVAMTLLAETFRVALTGPMLDGYWLILEELTETEMRAAVRQAIATQKFMPAPAELLAFARPPHNHAADVIQAWQAVRNAIDEHDYLVASIDFGPLVNAVIRNLGGWDMLCRASLPELDNPGWLRKRFDQIYTLLSTADATTLHGEPLAGALPAKWDKPLHVTVSLDGSPARLRIESNGDARKSIAEHIEALADKKASNG